MKIIRSTFKNIAGVNKSVVKDNLQIETTKKQRTFKKFKISMSAQAHIKGGIMAIDIDGL